MICTSTIRPKVAQGKKTKHLWTFMFSFLSTSSHSESTYLKVSSCAIRVSMNPVQRIKRCSRKQRTFIKTKTNTKTSGIPVCTKHCLNSSGSGVSTQFMNVSTEDIMIKVKKNRCRRTPREFLCHTMIPSFFTKMSLTRIQIIKGIAMSGYIVSSSIGRRISKADKLDVVEPS